MLHDEDDLVPCPYCKAPIYEDSQRCPECGNYISEEDAPPALKPWWIIVGALAVLAVVAMWVRFGS
jgi:predicted nucleic acid-binding Zn ribbon protein